MAEAANCTAAAPQKGEKTAIDVASNVDRPGPKPFPWGTSRASSAFEKRKRDARTARRREELTEKPTATANPPMGPWWCSPWMLPANLGA